MSYYRTRLPVGWVLEATRRAVGGCHSQSGTRHLGRAGDVMRLAVIRREPPANSRNSCQGIAVRLSNSASSNLFRKRLESKVAGNCPLGTHR